MITYIGIGLALAQFFLSFYCWRKWHQWENAYWNLRGNRDKEMIKKTQVMPVRLSWSKYND